MPTITLPSGRQFQANDGEPLLDAALRAGVALEHSCRTGRCGNCKARIASGSTVVLHDETGLTATERDAGWILSCARTAATDVALDADDLGGIRLFSARTWPCRIQALERLAPDVLQVTLRLPPTAAFNYHPGQYVDVIGPGGVRRSYSVANAARADKQVELHVREVPGGQMSAYWFGMAKANDLLRLHGPAGTFFVREAGGMHLVFLATGTGMAPVKAMLEGLAMLPEAERPASVAVYWGGRTPADLYWQPETIDTPHRFTPVLSRADSSWRGVRGHVQQALLADGPDLARTLAYACGSDAMIHDSRALLLKAGLPARRFHSDAFVCSAPA